MKRTARYAKGSVVYDKRRKTWNLFYYEGGKRRSHLIGTLSEYPTKSAACKAADALTINNSVGARREAHIITAAPTVNTLVEQYRKEKMPERYSTSCGYNSWLKNHIVPKWGFSRITDLQARPVELWLRSLVLEPKSKSHIRGLLSTLWDFAMWSGHIATQRNPMELVTVKGASKRSRKPRSLTVEEFQCFISNLKEPFGTIALTCVGFGLRISECLGLRWSDVDWLNGTLCIERGIVRQHVDDVKTGGSRKNMSANNLLLDVLLRWRQISQFQDQEDWIFASPVQIGKLPWSYSWVLKVFQKAASDRGIGKIGTHAMRHTYRAWLDAVGTNIAVQQKLMRHADIRTTMNIYGDVVTNEMSEAQHKIAGLAVNSTQTARDLS